MKFEFGVVEFMNVKNHFDTQCVSSTAIATMHEKNPSLSKASCHFTVVRAFRAQKNELSQPRHYCSYVFLGHKVANLRLKL